jgi:hypothetical protein
MKYIICTGYFKPPPDRFPPYPIPVEDFYQLWWENTMKYAKPERVLVLAGGGHSAPNAPGQWIPLSGDLGHVHDLESGRKPYHWTGWSMTIMSLLLLAYYDECDAIWKEQDVLAFGPWVETMYEEIGDKGLIYGQAKCMPAVQSIFLCKHWFIPRFVRMFLGTGSEQYVENEGERKFQSLGETYPQVFTRYSFGVDRDRPLPFDSKVWYAQHLNAEELNELKARGLT